MAGLTAFWTIGVAIFFTCGSSSDDESSELEDSFFAGALRGVTFLIPGVMIKKQ